MCIPSCAAAGTSSQRFCALSTSTLYLATRAAERFGGTTDRPAVGIVDRDESKNLTELLRLRPELLHPGVTLIDGDALPPPSSGLRLAIIDTPPGLSAIQSLKEAHLVLVPVHPEDQGVANLVKYLRNIEAQRVTVSPSMRLVALLPAMVERTVLHRERLEDIRRIAARHQPPLLVLPPIHSARRRWDGLSCHRERQEMTPLPVAVPPSIEPQRA